MYDLTTKSKKCDVKLTQPVKFSKWLDRHILAVVTETEVITIDSREGQPPAIPSSHFLFFFFQFKKKKNSTSPTSLTCSTWCRQQGLFLGSTAADGDDY